MSDVNLHIPEWALPAYERRQRIEDLKRVRRRPQRRVVIAAHVGRRLRAR